MHQLPEGRRRTPSFLRLGLICAGLFFIAALVGGLIGGVLFGGNATATVICFVLVLTAEMWAYDRYFS